MIKHDNLLKTEEDIKKERDFMSAVLDTVGSMVLVLDRDGEIVHFNHACEEVTGYPIGILSHMNVLDLFRDDRVLVQDKVREVFEKGKASAEARIVTKNGETIPFLLTGYQMVMDGEQYFVGVCIDLSERKHLEEQLRQSQKIECIGALSSGIAHDFNNILTAIIGYGNVLLKKMKQDEPMRHIVEQILASSDRAANLTQGLLAYGRKKVQNPQLVDLNRIIRKLEYLLISLVGEDVELKTILSAKDTTIMADSGQMEQMLMNVATNARDAMPNGGFLYIETERLNIDESSTKSYDFQKPGEYVLIAVTDSSMGIDAQRRNQLFESSLTIKDTNKEISLGLVTAYNIIKQHNGSINVYSEEGRGTTFKIYLPIAAPVKGTSVPAISPPPIKGGTETVLVAEDDESVRGIVCDMLEQFGYQVIQAVDGEDAVTKFMSNQNSVQLLVMDVIMPKKSGQKAYEKIRIFKPDIKVLFSSGYTADILCQKGLLDRNMNFILKPAPMNDLLRKVRSILDQ